MAVEVSLTRLDFEIVVVVEVLKLLVDLASKLNFEVVDLVVDYLY